MHTQEVDNMDKTLFDIQVDLRNIDKKFTSISSPTIYFRGLSREQLDCYMNIIMELHKKNFFDIEKLTIN